MEGQGSSGGGGGVERAVLADGLGTEGWRKDRGTEVGELKDYGILLALTL